MLTSDPGRASTSLKRNLRDIRLKNRLDFDVTYFCSLSLNNFLSIHHVLGIILALWGTLRWIRQNIYFCV